MKKSKKTQSIELKDVEKDIHDLINYIEKIENLNYNEEENSLDEDTDIINEEVNKLEKTIKEKYKDYLDIPKENNTDK